MIDLFLMLRYTPYDEDNDHALSTPCDCGYQVLPACVEETASLSTEVSNMETVTHANTVRFTEGLWASILDHGHERWWDEVSSQQPCQSDSSRSSRRAESNLFDGRFAACMWIKDGMALFRRDRMDGTDYALCETTTELLSHSIAQQHNDCRARQEPAATWRQWLRHCALLCPMLSSRLGSQAVKAVRSLWE